MFRWDNHERSPRENAGRSSPGAMHGRSNVLATDIRTALLDYQIPSDEALQQAFEPIQKRREIAIQTVGGGSFAPSLQCRRTLVAQ